MRAQAWNDTINLIRESIPPAQFQRWFGVLEFISHDERSIRLGVPSSFHEDWLKTNYTQQLQGAIRKNFGSDLQLEFEILVQDQNLEASFSAPPLPTAATNSQRPSLRLVEGGNEDFSQSQPDEAQEKFDANLPVFSGGYYELGFNRMASQVATMLADVRDSQVNLLFVNAGVGMGKTHLLTRVGEAILASDPSLRVRYTNGEKFTNEIFQSWKDRNGPDYRVRYRDETDVLLFDDVHVLAGRKATQDALLHIFNEIVGRGGRIIFTANQPPGKLAEFSDALRSRLQAGITAEIRTPNYDEKVALLSLIAQQNQIAVDEPVLRTLADQNVGDLRELLGSLLRVHLQARIENRPLDSTFVAAEQGKPQPLPEAITLEEIVAMVEHAFGISRVDLVSKCRKGVIAWARQVAMYLARRFTLNSLEDIGKAFGRDHSTVLYAYEKVNETIEAQPAKKYELDFLIQKLQARMPRSTDDCPL